MPEQSLMSDAADARIAALEAELAAQREAMQAFTATVSHDLRAPLRHIVSFAQLVQEDAGPQLGAEVQGFLSTITDSARHLGVLLDGLAELARIGTLPVALGPVPLQALVQGVCAELAEQYPGRAVDWHIASDLPVVQADATLLRQALMHVLGNAVKFTAPREHAVIAVTAQPGESDGFVALQVRDNGVGYNPAMQDKLFQAFGRLHSPREFGGIGMGLALTHKIMQRLGGSVDSEGVVDGGCCVKLLLKT
jgi:two-component system, OmpR family, sensor kinase